MNAKITTVLLLGIAFQFVRIGESSLLGSAIDQWQESNPDFPPIPSGDGFATRAAVSGANFVVFGTLAGATSEPGEPIILGSSGAQTLWWSWTAPVGGMVSLDLAGSDYSFPVGVFTGSALSNQVLIASDSGSVWFEAVEGETYQIQVCGAAGQTGGVQLRLRGSFAELSLLNTVSRSPKLALLNFAGSPRQVVFLLRSYDGTDWQTVTAAVAHRSKATFLVRPAPSLNGPFYWAVVIGRMQGSVLEL